MQGTAREDGVVKVWASSVALETDLNARESIRVAARGGRVAMQIAVASRTTHIHVSISFVLVRPSESWDRVAVAALEWTWAGVMVVCGVGVLFRMLRVYGILSNPLLCF